MNRALALILLSIIVLAVPATSEARRGPFHTGTWMSDARTPEAAQAGFLSLELRGGHVGRFSGRLRMSCHTAAFDGKPARDEQGMFNVYGEGAGADPVNENGDALFVLRASTSGRRYVDLITHLVLDGAGKKAAATMTITGETSQSLRPENRGPRIDCSGSITRRVKWVTNTRIPAAPQGD